MITWKESKPEIETHKISSLFSEFGLINSLRIIHNSYREIFIVVDKLVHARIYKHLLSSQNELGGLLIGELFSLKDFENGILGIYVNGCVPSKKSQSSKVSLSMHSILWEEARSRIGDGKIILGWYHSHPRIGAFFSSTDRKTQNSFFNHNYNIGLVVDPINREEKYFLGKDAEYVNNILYY